MSNHYSFVVLHYLAKETTLECVKTILALQIEDSDIINIVVVENGCHDNVEEYLSDHLSETEMALISVVVSAENLGFAKGNNLGYSFAKDHGSPDFMIVCNNDILFVQTDTCKKLVKAYGNKPFDIMGPDVFDPLLEVHQSPRDGRIPVTNDYVASVAQSIEKGLDGSYSNEKWLKIKYWIKRTPLGPMLRKAIHKTRGDAWKTRCEGVELQGACVVYSKRYLNQMDWAFYPETFMYLEELIQLVLSQQHGFVQVYDPSVRVHHMHAVSTALGYPDEIEKRRFYFREVQKSMGVLKKLMQSKEE